MKKFSATFFREIALLLSAGGAFLLPVQSTFAQNLPPVPEPSVTSIADFYTALKAVAQWVLVFGLIIGVLFIIYGAVMVLTSAGEDRKLSSGKATITWAVVGVILLILAYALVNIIANFFGVSGQVITP